MIVWLSYSKKSNLAAKKPLYKYDQNQPPRGVPKKRWSENMQQIFRRTPMSKCGFNKFALQGTPLGGCFWMMQAFLCKYLE